MKKVILIVIGTLFMFSIDAQSFKINDSIKPYVDFLKDNTFLSPKEYILQSFEDKDIIVFSERHHAEMKQYELIVDVMKDPRFKGYIYTEVGMSSNAQKIINLLQKVGLSEQELKMEIAEIAKNLDYAVIWSRTNYYYLIESVYRINQSREKRDKILIFPLDVAFNQNLIQNYSKFIVELMEPDGFAPVIGRNELMAKKFIQFYEYVKDKNKDKIQALVIQNTYHGYVRIPKYLPLPTEPNIYSTAEYIYKTYPEITKGIHINYKPNHGQKLSADGKFDAAFRVMGNKNIGFDLKNTPFGNTEFDLYNFGGTDYEKANYDFIFDGFIFYEPLENFELVEGIEGIYDDIKFIKEMYKRYSGYLQVPISKIKKDKELNQEVLDLPKIIKSKLSNLENYNLQIERWLK